MARRYYPSCVVALGIRFDEALHYIRSQSKTPTTEIQRRTDTPIQPTQEPLFISSGNSDPLSWLLNRVPRSANVTKPGYRDAGTFDVEIGYRELPFDPRLIKAMQVRVFFGTVDPDDFARGVTERVQVGDRAIRVVSPSILQTADDQGHPNLGLLAIWGIADKVKRKGGENPTFNISGRDLRSLFLTSPMRRGVLGKLDQTQPIDLVVKQLIESHPLGAQMRISVQASDWPDGRVPAPGATGNLTKVHLGASGKAKTGPPPAMQESKLNYWQAIYQYCFIVGAVPVFEGIQLVIRPAPALYDLRDKVTYSGTRAPFTAGVPRRGPDGRPFAIRKLIEGFNVTTVDFERSLQGPDRPRVIEVVCLDTSSPEKGKAKLLRAVWPRDVAAQLRKKHATKESPSGQLAESEVQRIPVTGIRSQDQLDQIAKAIWETTSRYEVEGSFESKDLASYQDPRLDGNDDADLLRLNVGDPVEISVAAPGFGKAGESPIVSEVTRFAGMSFDEAVLDVAAQVGDTNFARALVATSRNLVVETESTYRVSEVHIAWSKDSGARVTGKFHNFIEAAYGEAGPPKAPSGQKSVTARATTTQGAREPIDSGPNFNLDE